MVVSLAAVCTVVTVARETSDMAAKLSLLLDEAKIQKRMWYYTEYEKIQKTWPKMIYLVMKIS